MYFYFSLQLSSPFEWLHVHNYSMNVWWKCIKPMITLCWKYRLRLRDEVMPMYIKPGAMGDFLIQWNFVSPDSVYPETSPFGPLLLGTFTRYTMTLRHSHDSLISENVLIRTISVRTWPSGLMGIQSIKRFCHSVRCYLANFKLRSSSICLR